MPQRAVGKCGKRAVGNEISGNAGGSGWRSGKSSTRRRNGTLWRISCELEVSNVNVGLTFRKTQVPGGAAVRQLDFTPMDAFMTHVLETFRMDAERATKVFPPGARVILSFCERVANDVVCLPSSVRTHEANVAHVRLENTFNHSLAKHGSCRRICSCRPPRRLLFNRGNWSKWCLA